MMVKQDSDNIRNLTTAVGEWSK